LTLRPNMNAVRIISHHGQHDALAREDSSSKDPELLQSDSSDAPHARISFTTEPKTSVRRKSRPA